MDHDDGDLSPAGRVARVLVLEDDVDAAYLIGKMLFRIGLQGVPATDGRTAREAALLMAPIDLILADVDLDGEDGLAIALEIKGVCGCQVIMTSGFHPPASEVPRGVDA